MDCAIALNGTQHTVGVQLSTIVPIVRELATNYKL